MRTDFRRPVSRYLAAKGFASWLAYQGHGVRTVVFSLAAALAVLKVEAARQSARVGRALDRDLLLEASRAADLLLVHLASREDLARRLTPWRRNRLRSSWRQPAWRAVSPGRMVTRSLFGKALGRKR